MAEGVQIIAGEGMPSPWRFVSTHGIVLISILIFIAPVLAALGRDVWSTEQGAQGPIILVSGLWLLWHEAQGKKPGAERPSALLVALLLVLAGAVTVYSSIINKLWLECAAAYVTLLVVFWSMTNLAYLRTMWFPLFYLSFLIPPPNGFILPLTRHLKLAISDWSVSILNALGFDVQHNGASLFIDSYELVVAAACSGLNSMVSLVAVGLLYAYLRYRTRPQYALVLVLIMVPLAIVANLIRVILLLLGTHYFGSFVVDGILHETTGFVIFILALGLLLIADSVLLGLWNRREQRWQAV